MNSSEYLTCGELTLMQLLDAISFSLYNALVHSIAINTLAQQISK